MSARLDVKKVGAEVKDLLRKVDAAQWVIGDYLIDAGVTSSGQFARVAKEAGVEPGTLENYRQVSAEFPPERRNTALAWGVFKQLSRIHDEQWQDNFLKSHPRVTTSATEVAVAAEMRNRHPGGPRSRNKETDRAVAGNLTVDVEDRTDRGTGRVEITGFTGDAKLSYNETTGAWEVQGLTS